jgi:hypothetical protein
MGQLGADQIIIIHLMNWIRVFAKKALGAPLPFHYVKTQQEGTTYESLRDFSPKPKSASTYILDFPTCIRSKGLLL